MALSIGIFLVIIILLIVGGVVFFKLFYTSVPQGYALLVSNQNVYFTNAFILPTKNKQLINLEPVHIKLFYTDGNGLICKEKLLVNMGVTYSLYMELTPEAILKAVNKVGAESMADTRIIQTALSEVLEKHLRKTVSDFAYDVLDKDRGKVRKALLEQLTGQLYGYKLDYMTIEQVELASMDILEKQNTALFNEQLQIRHEWDVTQKKLLEQRLRLITEHQQALSVKIKEMIESYQKIIRDKIKLFINREELLK